MKEEFEGTTPEISARSGFSRRAFLGLGATAAVAAGVGLSACSAGSSSSSSTSSSKGSTAPSRVDKKVDTDLLIIGGGGSGMACAVQASLDKTNCILIEKSSQLGGNAQFVEGMFAIGTPMAQAQGINVTAAEITEAELVRGQHRQNGAFWIDLCDKSAGNISWCIEQGVLYSGVIDDYHGGLFPTFHWFKSSRAAVGYVEPMVARIDNLGIEVHLKTAATMLIIDSNGKVTGAYAEGDDGVIQYNAKAVILASGGFGGNPELIEKQGWNIEDIFVVGSPNAAGDGYKMAMEAGAKDFIQNSAQSILYNIPALPSIDFHNDALNNVNGYFGLAAGGPVLWINESCERYTRENLTDDNLVLQCIPGRDNLANYCIFDQKILDENFTLTDENKKMFNDALADDSTGSLFKVDSVDKLAQAFDLDEGTFKETLDRYNGYCASGSDKDFGKPAKMMQAISTPPFYIAKMAYSFFFEVGGITTDKQRRVLDDTQAPIPGLYAIGNDGNMNYRHVYTINMPGTAFGNQVNSGREAAQNAAEYLKAY